MQNVLTQTLKYYLLQVNIGLRGSGSHAGGFIANKVLLEVYIKNII